MADATAIEWTDSTWNPVTGCTKVSAGCDHCYAERFSERFRGVPNHPFEQGFDLRLRPERLRQPLSWTRPRFIFVNSMSDLFHKEIPNDFIEGVFDTMEQAHWHVYQVLTKRSSLLRDFVNRRYGARGAPPHIWLGVSIEDRAALRRLAHLKATHAAVRFVSCEPLLESLGPLDLSGIHWVIAGGESGPGARPVEASWVREIRDACVDQNAAFFFKQWGGRTPKARGSELDGRAWQQYPVSVRGERAFEARTVAGAPPESEGDMDVGPWAREKLDCLRKYLHAYTTIMRKQRFRGYFYIDAFAGPGNLKLRGQAADPVQDSLLDLTESDDDESAYINGSPRVALDIEHPFTDYVFVEMDAARADRLDQLAARHPASRVHVRRSDCNTYLRELLERNAGQWAQWRGVVFLDPFGMQVPWSTIEALGRTGSIEILLNFPVGMAIQRLLKRSGSFTAAERAKLDVYFGSPEWFDLLYERKSDLLGTNLQKIAGSADVLVRWYRTRLKAAFGYASTAREVCNSKGRPLYYLIFAGRNQTGARIANDVLRQGARIVR
jgi:three-Cys-motif partner protein